MSAAASLNAQDAIDRARHIAEEVDWLLDGGQSLDAIAKTLGFVKATVLKFLQTAGHTEAERKWKRRAEQHAADMQTYIEAKTW